MSDYLLYKAFSKIFGVDYLSDDELFFIVQFIMKAPHDEVFVVGDKSD